MNSSVVTIRVNGQPYQLGCDPGQEAEIEALGKMVDETVSSLSASVGKIGSRVFWLWLQFCLLNKPKHLAMQL